MQHRQHGTTRTLSWYATSSHGKGMPLMCISASPCRKKATLVAALSAALGAQATAGSAAAAVKVEARPSVKPEQDPQVRLGL